MKIKLDELTMTVSGLGIFAQPPVRECDKYSRVVGFEVSSRSSTELRVCYGHSCEAENLTFMKNGLRFFAACEAELEGNRVITVTMSLPSETLQKAGVGSLWLGAKNPERHYSIDNVGEFTDSSWEIEEERVAVLVQTKIPKLQLKSFNFSELQNL